jgi:dTDP-L-rhamnose 4-epimerase
LNTHKVLITGGLGFIGLEVARLLVEQWRSVLLFDNLSSQIHGAIPDLSRLLLLRNAKVEVFRGDVLKASDWSTALPDVETIIHLAAETGTAQSMYEISRYSETNVGGTARLLDHLANHKHSVRKIILASSRAVYGEGAYRCSQCSLMYPGSLVYPPARSESKLRAADWQPACPRCRGSIEVAATPETAPTAPASVYAATKLAQEDLVRVAAKSLGIPAVIFRFQNVYGEGQSLKNPYTGMLSIFSNQMRLGKTVHLYEDGRESRDFVHVSDVARAVALGLSSGAADGATMNVGSGKPTSVAEVAMLLEEHWEAKSPAIISGEYRLGDIRHGFADLAAIRAQLQFVPEISLEEGLTRFVGWVKTQAVEPDRLETASRELVAHGLMPPPASADDAGQIQDRALPGTKAVNANAKATSV